MTMRIMVQGADDFIGRDVMRALAASDWASPLAASPRADGGRARPAGRTAGHRCRGQLRFGAAAR